MEQVRSQATPEPRPRRTRLTRLGILTQEGFEAVRLGGRPGVFRTDPNASEPWSIERIAQLFGNMDVHASRNLPRTGNVFEATSVEEIVIPWNEFVSRLVSSTTDTAYLILNLVSPSEGIRAHLPQGVVETLLSQLPQRTVGLAYAPNRTVHLWLGTGGTRSGWHFDFSDNLFWQMFGTKHVLLGDGAEARAFYPRSNCHYNSRVDADDPDLSRFPRYADATLLDCTLAAGDLLYIPRGWWHSLRSLNVSSSISCVFGDELPLSRHAKVILAGGPEAWKRVISDVFMQGLLRHN